MNTIEFNKLREEVEKLVKLNLWQARRLQHRQHKEFAYDELEKITEVVYERV